MRKTAHIIIAVILLSLLIPASISAQIITIQAEAFADSNDIAYGVIRSLGAYIEGLDYPDEWVEYELFGLSAFGEYSVRVTIRGTENTLCELSLILTGGDSGDTQTCDFAFVGTGMG